MVLLCAILLFFASTGLAETSENCWALVSDLQQKLASENDAIQKALLEERIATLIDQITQQSDILPQIAEEKSLDFQLSQPTREHSEQTVQNTQNKNSDRLEKYYKDIQEQLCLIATCYSSKKFLMPEDKVFHDRISFFFSSRLSELRAYLDVVQSDEEVDATILQHVEERCEILTHFVQCCDYVYAAFVAAFVLCDHEMSRWDDVSYFMLYAIEQLIPVVQKCWNNSVQKESLALLQAQSEKIVRDVVIQVYQVSLIKRVFKKSYVDALLSISWSDEHRKFFKEYGILVTASRIGLQEHNRAMLQDQLNTFESILIRCDGLLQQVLYENSNSITKTILEKSQLALFALKSEIEEAACLLFDYTRFPSRAEMYINHVNIIKDPLFTKLLHDAFFKPYAQKYLIALEIAIKSDDDSRDVRYELFDTLSALKKLKGSMAQGYLKKMLFGADEEIQIVDQMIENVQKLYQEKSKAYLSEPDSFFQKLISGEWFKKEKIKKIFGEQCGNIAFDVIHHYVGQKFDTQDSATVYVVSIVAPLLLIAVLKYLVPNLPQKVQQKVTDFIRVMPTIEHDDNQLAQLIKENPEVVQTFLQQDPALSKALIEQIQAQISK